MIQHVEDIDESGMDSGKTALHLAVINWHANIVKVLLENGANPTTKDHGLETPIRYASKYNRKNPEIIKLLLGELTDTLKKCQLSKDEGELPPVGLGVKPK